MFVVATYIWKSKITVLSARPESSNTEAFEHNVLIQTAIYKSSIFFLLMMITSSLYVLHMLGARLLSSFFFSSEQSFSGIIEDKSEDNKWGIMVRIN